MSWLDENPDVSSIRVAAVDLNGQARGKRIPANQADKIVTDGTRMPFSALNLDILGEDIVGSPLVFESGDPDGVLKPTERGFLPMPWLAKPTALLPMWMFHENGQPFDGDPRHGLARIQDRFAKHGWTPVVATELEFFLVDDRGTTPRPPQSPRTGRRRRGSDTLALRSLDSFDEFFNDLYEACDQMGIPADAAISEAGRGQFEINLLHSPDALKAADDAWLFKMLVKGTARKHGFAASFMAKPYDEQSGNGMHAHFSVLDAEGRNIFDDGGPKGTAQLRQAIAGCLAVLADATLIFAPHANSYLRFVPGAHAPTGICWAYENRTAAVRVPGGNPAARRIEHRVAGGDINPYLMLAAVLGGALLGLENELEAPEPITGNAYELPLKRMPDTWGDAINAFEASALLPEILPGRLIENLVMTKRQELDEFDELSTRDQTDVYLDIV